MTQSDPETTSSPAPPQFPSPPVGVVTPRDPFRALGIVGFALSFVAIANIGGLVVSVIAMVRSKRAGFTNGFAVAGTVISSLGVVITIALASFAVWTLVGAAQTCARLGDGIHTVGPATYTCTPTSFSVHYGTTPTSSSTTQEQWVTANARYSEAICPTNAAREELAGAVEANDLAQLAPVAASASSAFGAAAGVFLDHPWPQEIEEDIRFLGETSAQLEKSWAAVAGSADLSAANAVPFPDAQTPFEASQRIRAALTQHGQESLGC